VQAFCFDRAVMIFGSSLSAELEKAKGKTDKQIAANRTRIIQKWIPEATGTARSRQKFRDPAKTV
jgi:hypothetical protein